MGGADRQSPDALVVENLISDYPIPPARTTSISMATFTEFLLVSGLFIFLARLLYWWHQKGRRSSFAYMPMRNQFDSNEVVATDCTHGTLTTLTHHKDDNNPVGECICSAAHGPAGCQKDASLIMLL